MIPLNKPFLPPLDDYNRLVEEIWKRNWLTNHGPLVKGFEKKISEYLGISTMVFVNNGTTALQVAIKALNLQGEIITTPFSYAATTNAIVWGKCSPVFVDIDQNSLNIDPSNIEPAVTPATTAILATHVYGNPCDVVAIQHIADKHGLKVIYDAAHCFGIRYLDDSIYKWGDISVASFHATKLFHTIEGGGLFCKDGKLRKKLRQLINFGHDGPYRFTEAGINGKNSEFHAAMGLCNLEYADKILEKRKFLTECYNSGLNNVPVARQSLREGTRYNYSYLPILFETESDLETAETSLSQAEVQTRRYFKPSLDLLPYTKKSDLPVAHSVSNRILCLPLYFDLSEEDVFSVCGIIKKCF
jgi:dTDP-4-amino-4,6-dideoxygalactose transaminase